MLLNVLHYVTLHYIMLYIYIYICICQIMFFTLRYHILFDFVILHGAIKSCCYVCACVCNVYVCTIHTSIYIYATPPLPYPASGLFIL